MQVTPEIFDHVAKLAKLRFAENEKEALREDMQKMVSFVEKLDELDTEGVAPLTHMSHVVQSPREDIAKKEYGKADGLRNAFVKDENYFLVPKVIENPNK